VRRFKDNVIRFNTLLRLGPILRKHLRAMWRGDKYGRDHRNWSRHDPSELLSGDSPNFLLKYFNEHTQGHGIWKWMHYFAIYDRHFARFRGKEVHVLEIGVYSGGSLQMWQNYFGPHSTIYGVDIEARCKVYESESVRIFIGDQADRNFWKRFKQEVPVLDIVIDDGGHTPEQQIVTLEELLPHLRPAGVYLCEDVVQVFNQFTSYMHGLAQNLNAFDLEQNIDNKERRLVCKTSPLQSVIASIHLYPFVTVVEKAAAAISEFIAPKHGTQWEPFLK
jgi:hypothetical protein